MSRMKLAPQRMPALQESLKKAAEILALEFRGLDGNELYTAAFSRVLRAVPERETGLAGHIGAQTPFMLGTDQRDLFIPHVASVLTGLRDAARVFDMGCGDGGTTSIVFPSLKRAMTIDLLDPNAYYLKKYAERAQGIPLVTIGDSRATGVDDVFATQREAYRETLDAVLGIHMIYFSRDIRSLVAWILDALRPGGRAVLVFADEARCFTGQMTRTYLENTDRAALSAFDATLSLRTSLFGMGEDDEFAAACQAAMTEALGRSDFHVDSAQRQAARLYGYAMQDILAMAFITGLFDLDTRGAAPKIDHVLNVCLTDPASLDLALERDGRRQGMYSVSQPQVVFVLRKDERSARRHRRSG